MYINRNESFHENNQEAALNMSCSYRNQKSSQNYCLKHISPAFRYFYELYAHAGNLIVMPPKISWFVQIYITFMHLVDAFIQSNKNNIYFFICIFQEVDYKILNKAFIKIT